MPSVNHCKIYHIYCRGIAVGGCFQGPESGSAPAIDDRKSRVALSMQPTRAAGKKSLLLLRRGQIRRQGSAVDKKQHGQLGLHLPQAQNRSD